MEVVIQEEPTGCGFANVAMLAKRRYAEVKALANSIGIFAADPRLYSDTTYVRRLLAEYGIRVSEQETPFTSWESLPERALLSIKYHVEDGQPFWHWVVFVRESGTPVVLDPAKYLSNNRRTDYKKMQPRWFIEVFGLPSKAGTERKKRPPVL